MQPCRNVVRLALTVTSWFTLVAGAACAGDGTDTSESAVQWDTLATGIVHAQCQRLPEEPRWTVEADLRLGSVDGEGEAVFGEIRGIEVDARGRLLVLDQQASEIQAFDADGQFLELFASSGEGPREISTANGIRVDSQGALWIHDYGRMRFTRLRSDGEIETYPFFVPGFSYLWEGGVTADGRLWSQWTHSDRPRTRPEPGVYHRESRAYYKSFDPSNNALDSILIGASPYHSIVVDRGVISVPYSATLLHVLDPAGFIWTALSSEYRLTKQTVGGDTLLVVTAGCEAPLVTTEEHDQAIERVESFMERAGRVRVDWNEVLPEHKPILEQLVVDDRSRLWVVRAEADGHVLDAFDPHGRFLGTIEPNFDFVTHFPPVVRNDRLYVLQLDSLDVPFVVRARIPAMP